MICCGQCFTDRGLRRHIIPRLSASRGRCPTCGAADVELVEAAKLVDYFELLCGIYRPNDDGKVLVDWLIEDWQIFAIDRANANQLLVEILDDGERVRQLVVPSDLCNTGRLDVWEALRDELCHRNRFFPDTDFEHDRLRVLLSSLMPDVDEVPLSWCRARISRDGHLISPEKMWAPPKRLATHGRANPAGIPYLYLGSETETAISEVRPHPGECVCVADFEINRDLKFIDLRSPRKLVSPFLLADEEAVALLRGDVDFLERLGNELTTPVLPSAAAIDYIPSQYLCEFIKKCDYDGVLYSSSVSSGVNLALFDPSKASVGLVKRYMIKSVDVDFREVP